MTIFYDDALPLFASIVNKELGTEALLTNIFLRDATGRLTFVAKQKIQKETLVRIANEAEKTLKPYVGSADEAVSTVGDILDDTLSQDHAGRVEFLLHSDYSGFVRVVERRIVGHDWLSPPREPVPGLPPVVVFASHKGGVGRSTALAVVASDFASSNLNVLAVDLDLEAPGIGGMLLNEDSAPEFGSLDFFVESGLQPLSSEFSQRMIGVSPLTQGQGVIDVLPATGRRSQQYPQNVLGKIARAYLDAPADDIRAKTFLDQTRSLLGRVAERRRYDVILVDVRAGLNESAAAAILGLGADVLLFGVNTPQTFEGYRYLLSHLAMFRPEPTDKTDWRLRLKMIHAKAAAKSSDWKAFRDASFNLFSEQLYEEDATGDAFNFDIDDAQAPHSPWIILNDSNYFEFNPLQNQAQLGALLYERTFSSLLRGLRDRLGITVSSDA
jgi:Mrp family chromosome partitioning ATPase